MVKRESRRRRRDGSCLREIQEDLWDSENSEEVDSEERPYNRNFRRKDVDDLEMFEPENYPNVRRQRRGRRYRRSG